MRRLLVATAGRLRATHRRSRLGSDPTCGIAAVRTTTVRNYQGGGDRQRLRLPLWGPPIDVCRDAGRRHSDRSDGLGRPEAVTTYIDEIKKVTSQPIKYVVYSHSHYDHITGGKPFKDLGARFIAHKNAKAQLERLQPPNIVLPDEVVDSKHTLKLGGTTLELLYVGRNHSDNSLVMWLPKERIIFAVDFIPVQALFWRNMPDSWLDEWEGSLKRVLAMDWDKLIPGHPGPGGRLGNKQDVENLLQYMADLAGEVKKVADEGKCYDTAMKEVKLPKYESPGNYGIWLDGNVERYCYLYRSGS